MIKIYEMAHSPYCIPVTQICECYGLPHERIAVPNWDRRALAALTGGAYYQVPVLEVGGQMVHETVEDPLAVARFLDANYCCGKLFPAAWSGMQELIVGYIESDLEGAGFKLADIHYVPAIEDLGERTMVIRHKERSFGRGCVDRWREQKAALAEQFDSMLGNFDRRLAASPFLFGDEPIYADYSLFGVIGNVTFNGWNPLNPRLENVVRWHGELKRYRATEGK